MKILLVAILSLGAFTSPGHANFFFEGLEPFAERHCHPPLEAGDDPEEKDFDGPECPEGETVKPAVAIPLPKVPQK